MKTDIACILTLGLANKIETNPKDNIAIKDK